MARDSPHSAILSPMKPLAWLLLLVALTAFCQTPDRPPLADEWGYRPADGARVALNPPSLTWVLEKDAASFTVEWADNSGFARSTTVRDLPWSVYTHHAPLKPGPYWWRYRIAANDGSLSAWSRARSFVVPPDATVFPQPTMEQLRKVIPREHPRLFVRRQDLPRLRAWSEAAGKEAWQKLIARAEQLLTAEPTAEPAVRASASDPATNQYWWSNRVQTLRALQEAEILSFVWLLTGERKYGERARRFTLALAAWDPDGPTNFRLNCEAAKPMLHRLARAYDWAWEVFTEEERARIRAVLLRRALDAWNSGEVRQGAGHLNQPYSSHGNRTWHKLAENALATLGETSESEKLLDYAVTKFFAAYPVWSDDDGGWHEGLSYFAGYMSKAAWWMDFANSALGIDGFRKPFFAHFGDYALYAAPPGTPDLGFGDLSHRPPSAGWAFMHYYVRRTRNPHWAWWLEAWKIPAEVGEPVLEFLWGATPPVESKAPTALPASKVFHGTGIAALNSTLLSAADNVQIRFKSSPMGRWSHGLEPHNTFTLNAYGLPLLVNCVYRDLYGSPFHKGWVWGTRAHNAVLVDGHGQKPRSADLGGRILKSVFEDGMDYVAGDATDSYEGRLKRARRHIFFVKPDVIVIADELAAPQPSAFQWMLHAQAAFEVKEDQQRLLLDRGAAGVVVDYVAQRPLKLRQWTGYDPPPDAKYLASVGNSIPPQWHVEAASAEPAPRAFTLTVLRPHRRGAAPLSPVRVEWVSTGLSIRVTGAGQEEVAFTFQPDRTREFAVISRASRQWRI
ncbi:MAG: DUF4962 domain-containing protein, partial [Acidobacteria bacterium]|nr:DUF4962 domain-containing protein [Acidobacteriota bacterium]